MNMNSLLNLTEIHQEIDQLLKCDFREIQKQFSTLTHRYSTLAKLLLDSPKKQKSFIPRTPSTLFSTPRKTPKRKLKLTPQKAKSSAKSSRKNSENSSTEADSIFGRPLKVNLHDIFHDYISSSDDSKGNKY